MGKATGAFLVIAGLGTAALVLPSVDREAERQLSDIVRTAMGTTQEVAAPATPPPAPVAAPAQKVAAAPAPIVPAPVEVKSSVRAAAITTGSIEPTQTNDKPKLVMAPPPVTTPSAQTTSVGELARAIQKELRRVGCYSGEISGEWNDQTRKSMRQFVERVNATLPVDNPDHILKMLVQGHPGNACGDTCPSGQQMSATGRCLPSAIVAQKPTLVPKRGAVQTAEAAKHTPTSTVAATPSAPAAPSPKSGVTVEQTTGPTATSSWATTDAATRAVAPLPGRMAIGAPRSGTDAGQRTDQPLSSTDAPSALPKRVAAKPTGDDVEDTGAAAKPVEAKKPRAAEKVRGVRSSPRVIAVAPPVYRAPPPVRYSYSRTDYTLSATPRKFGPHIFSDTRWAR